jgi:ACS family pantothenate transporter-like MFS transporter
LGTATVQLLLWLDKKKAAKAEAGLSAIDPLESSSIDGDTSAGSREDDGKVASTSRVKNVGLD